VVISAIATSHSYLQNTSPKPSSQETLPSIPSHKKKSIKQSFLNISSYPKLKIIMNTIFKLEDIHNLRTEVLSELNLKYHGKELTDDDIEILRIAYKKESDLLTQELEGFCQLVYQSRKERRDAWSRSQIESELKRMVADFHSKSDKVLANIMWNDPRFRVSGFYN
jgi:hypothetical protein